MLLMLLLLIATSSRDRARLAMSGSDAVVVRCRKRCPHGLAIMYA